MIDIKKAREICESATPPKSNYETIHEALDEIAFYGTSRPREMGEGDDGDGHYRKIAYSLISIAAIARRQVRGPDSEFIQFSRTALPEALDEIESLRKRLELAEKVCEAANEWDDRDQHSMIPDTSDKAVKLGAALEEWRNGEGK